jgi:hypothetical protein
MRGSKVNYEGERQIRVRRPAAHRRRDEIESLQDWIIQNILHLKRGSF